MAGPGETAQAEWIFGYGSLVWRPDFEFAERRTGFVLDRARRFWQASTDHRGTPARPGRVVTLIPRPGCRCFGAAYRLHAGNRTSVLAGLDHRERGGFIREKLPVYFPGSESGEEAATEALVYVATPSNPNYLGPERTSHGIDACKDPQDLPVSLARKMLGDHQLNHGKGPTGPHPVNHSVGEYHHRAFLVDAAQHN